MDPFTAAFSQFSVASTAAHYGGAVVLFGGLLLTALWVWALLR